VTIQLQQTDTASTHAAAAMCSGATLGSVTAARKATAGGAAGSTSTTVTIGGLSINRACVFFESAVNEPNQTSWASGNYVIRLNISVAAGALGQWIETWVCRCNSAGTNQATVGSLTGQTTDISTTGVKTHTVSGSAQTANASDQVYFVLVFNRNAAKGGSSFQFTPDQLIDTPLVSAGGGGALTKNSLMGFYRREENPFLSRRGQRNRRKAFEMLRKAA